MPCISLSIHQKSSLELRNYYTIPLDVRFVFCLPEKKSQVGAFRGSTNSAHPGPSLPSLDLLTEPLTHRVDEQGIGEQAEIIIQTLSEFGVPASIVEIHQGPRTTRFGVQPGFITKMVRGEVQRRRVKVSAITSLADDLALALATQHLRIESPVPGKSYIGLEVPNRQPAVVTLLSVLKNPAFSRIKNVGGLPIALGSDVVGNAVAADLSSMPHLLIAGATGSGKSVCVNTLIASLLLTYGPNHLRFLMIDPKTVELIGYNGIPHLITPVVTDMDKVLATLTWAVGEMERRYELFGDVGQRHLSGYNDWARSTGEEVLPFIVIIIDELADLMMTVPDDAESLIVRLAQKARATGIHLVLATQRPTVNVVTGLIKANIPTRIAFAVTSGVDSKVILDRTGAETLLGRGDMLYKAADALNLLRLQGCFVADDELERLVKHWRSHTPPLPLVQLPLLPSAEINPHTEIDNDEEDRLLPQAIDLAKKHHTVSTSFFQRKLRIGYARAARLVDVLEERGIIGPLNGRQAREVLLETQG